MKSILFLGGGLLGVPVIEWAKEIGFHIIVNDKNENAPGFSLADVKVNFDSTDIRSLTTWAVNNNDKYNILYCYCGSDFGLLTATVIHDVLNIPHAPLGSIIKGLDKSLMKKFWAYTEGINYPLSKIVNSKQDIIEAGRELGWPLIIKPTSSSGSQGVSLANNVQEGVLCFHEATKYAKTGHIIAEQFIKGTHHDVNGLFLDDVFYPCGIGDRFFTPFPYCVPHHGYFPSVLEPSIMQKMYCMLEKGARSMGIASGPVKADSVFSNDKCYVYEISPRFHGDVFISNVMGFLKNVNPVYQFLNWIFKDKSDVFIPIKNDTSLIGGWKTIFNNSEKEQLTNIIGLYDKNSRQVKVVKNNNEIIGLAWAWETTREKINTVLKIDPYD